MSESTAIDHFPLHEFTGEPYELGRAHGAALASAIRQQVSDALTVAAQGGLDRAAALAWSRAQLPKIERLAPHWIDELRGIAAGAGISLDEAIALQVRPGSGKMIGGCTSIAASDGATVDGRALGAQNRDLFHGFRERMVVTLLRPVGGTPLLMHSVPGELGGTGLNAHGLAIFANSLWARSGRTWMAPPLLRRLLLEQRDAASAAELAKQLDGPAVGSFLLVDVVGQIRNLEILPEQMIVTERNSGVYAHTNHCLATSTQSFEQQPLQSPGSPQRCRTMETTLAESSGKIDVAAMKRLLAQHQPTEEPICRHSTKPGEYETAATSIVETASRRLHISYGPPCQGRFKTYSLTPQA